MRCNCFAHACRRKRLYTDLIFFNICGIWKSLVGTYINEVGWNSFSFLGLKVIACTWKWPKRSRYTPLPPLLPVMCFKIIWCMEICIQKQRWHHLKIKPTFNFIKLTVKPAINLFTKHHAWFHEGTGATIPIRATRSSPARKLSLFDVLLDVTFHIQTARLLFLFLYLHLNLTSDFIFFNDSNSKAIRSNSSCVQNSDNF